MYVLEVCFFNHLIVVEMTECLPHMGLLRFSVLLGWAKEIQSAIFPPAGTLSPVIVEPTF